MAAPGFDPDYLKSKDAAEALKRSAEKLESTNEHFREASVQFFEKLVVLDGGALAASATFLSYLFGKQAQPVLMSFRVGLHTAWVVLVLAMAAGMARNYFLHRYVWNARFKLYATKNMNYESAQIDFLHADKTVVDRYSGFPLDAAEEISIASSNIRKWEEAQRGAESKEKMYERLTAAFEYLALIGTLVGLCLLAAFAISNS